MDLSRRSTVMFSSALFVGAGLSLGCGTSHQLGLRPEMLPSSAGARFPDTCAVYTFTDHPTNEGAGFDEMSPADFSERVVELLSERVIPAGENCPVSIEVLSQWRVRVTERKSKRSCFENAALRACCLLAPYAELDRDTKAGTSTNLYAGFVLRFSAQPSGQPMGKVRGESYSSGFSRRALVISNVFRDFLDAANVTRKKAKIVRDEAPLPEVITLALDDLLENIDSRRGTIGKAIERAEELAGPTAP